MTVSSERLNAIYAATDDPWDFATSPYEQAKFQATREALSRSQYRASLEIGCGNGELARHLAPLCKRYTGIDAVGRAVLAAGRAVPSARFVQGFYPCPLPAGDFDLIVISEFLYFLGRDDIRALAKDLSARWPLAELLCVTYLGETDHTLQGIDALEVFTGTLAETHRFETRRSTDFYRIDIAQPEGHA
ncbi:hypothetical protein P775_16520 [Puniceibacterium antarcticum]|uniref:Methyltransferase domain-containing protein n=1 Tax=Puniceibacterium antarcticum TaxID=1206336 RepID=A0A2G8RBU6_9RHOB|nr:class I SAM-dependent methyltransferase [Puniceibacterium antarcticum]PIL19046.1 hypothetical protein P775_16520 [Puniceibacterium antarcticum]